MTEKADNPKYGPGNLGPGATEAELEAMVKIIERVAPWVFEISLED
ncbi:hypothetical protein V7O61_06525 [Methanolobus sp. WCC1]